MCQMEIDIQLLFISFMLILLPAILSRHYLMPAMVLFSFLTITLPVHYGLSVWIIVSAVISFSLFMLAAILSGKRHIFIIDKEIELKWWRIIARPFALLFIPIKIFIGHQFLLYLLGILSMIFIGIDLYRLFSGKHLSSLYKKKETKRFSSMTSFIVAIFILFLLFHDEVAYLCLVFILFGDMAGKFAGIRFSRIKIIQERTLEGSLGFLTGCFYAGFIVCSILNIEFNYLLIGAVFATLAELFSFNLDDNFTVGILTGGCLEALIYFQVI
jgi:dolichol kinase